MLIQKNRDAEKGFAELSNIAKADSLATWFSDRSVDREGFVLQLKAELLSIGQNYTDKGSAAGNLHRAWMNIKDVFSLGSDDAMLAEAIRGEKAALQEYYLVLEENIMPREMEILLNAQKAKVAKGLSALQYLKDIEYQEES